MALPSPVNALKHQQQSFVITFQGISSGPSSSKCMMQFEGMVMLLLSSGYKLYVKRKQEQRRYISTVRPIKLLKEFGELGNRRKCAKERNNTVLYCT